MLKLTQNHSALKTLQTCINKYTVWKIIPSHLDHFFVKKNVRLVQVSFILRHYFCLFHLCNLIMYSYACKELIILTQRTMCNLTQFACILSRSKNLPQSPKKARTKAITRCAICGYVHFHPKRLTRADGSTHLRLCCIIAKSSEMKMMNYAQSALRAPMLQH